MITVTTVESKPNIHIELTWDEAEELRVALSWARESLEREYKSDHYVLLHGLEQQFHQVLVDSR